MDINDEIEEIGMEIMHFYDGRVVGFGFNNSCDLLVHILHKKDKPFFEKEFKNKYPNLDIEVYVTGKITLA